MSALLLGLVASIPPGVSHALGELDPIFGDGGSVAVELEHPARTGSVALQPDGQILLFGSTGAALMVTRLNVDGAIDPSFGDGGIASIVGSENLYATSLVVDADGSFVVGAWTESDKILVVRFQGDGTLEPSFGQNGIAMVGSLPRACDPVACSGDNAHALAIDAEGGVLVVAPVYDASVAGSAIGVLRLTRDGTLDVGFGDLGIASVPLVPGTLDEPVGLALGAGGAIFVLGTSTTGDRRMMRLVSFRSDGGLETRFASGGSLEVPLETDARAGGIIVQPNGTIVLTGAAVAPDDQATDDVVMVRLLPSGRPDRAFGVGGIARVRLPENWRYQPGSVARLADGSLFAAGARRVFATPCSSYPRPWWVAFTQHGRRDGRFAEPPFIDSEIEAIAVDATGRLLLASISAGGFRCVLQPPVTVVERRLGPAPLAPGGALIRPSLPGLRRIPRLPRQGALSDTSTAFR